MARGGRETEAPDTLEGEGVSEGRRADVARTDVNRGGKIVAGHGSGRLRSFIHRHRKASVLGAVLGVAFVLFVLVWFQPQQAFLNRTVNETLPVGQPSASTGPSGSQAPPDSVEATLASGRFRSLEHHTAGRALLVRLADGTVILRFESLDTLNGPDLHVYLSEVPAGGDARAYGERFVDVGKLKGNRGNQNYRLPPNVDFSRYRSAVIWCKRFTVGFGVAPLS